MDEFGQEGCIEKMTKENNKRIIKTAFMSRVRGIAKWSQISCHRDQKKQKSMSWNIKKQREKNQI